MRATRRRRRVRMRAALSLAAAAVITAACGPAPTVEIAPGSAARQERERAGPAALPELPPLPERAPHLYDADGCARRPPDESGVDCGAEPPPHAGEPAPGDREHRALYGFRGPHYTADVQRDAVVVLDGTVATSDTGAWQARGLVRNETQAPAGPVTVTARLAGSDGQPVGEATGSVPVDPLRPGEPAPFVVRSDVDAADVAHVTWDVAVARPASGSPRETEISVHWQRPAGEGEAVALPGLHTDRGGERPYLLYGSARNDAGRAVARPRAVTAWLDGGGAVLHVAETPLVELGSGEPLAALPPGGLGDFLHVVDGGEAAGLEQATPMFWVVGS